MFEDCSGVVRLKEPWRRSERGAHRRESEIFERTVDLVPQAQQRQAQQRQAQQRMTGGSAEGFDSPVACWVSVFSLDQRTG